MRIKVSISYYREYLLCFLGGEKKVKKFLVLGIN